MTVHRNDKPGSEEWHAGFSNRAWSPLTSGGNVLPDILLCGVTLLCWAVRTLAGVALVLLQTEAPTYSRCSGPTYSNCSWCILTRLFICKRLRRAFKLGRETKVEKMNSSQDAGRMVVTYWERNDKAKGKIIMAKIQRPWLNKDIKRGGSTVAETTTPTHSSQYQGTTSLLHCRGLMHSRPTLLQHPHHCNSTRPSRPATSRWPGRRPTPKHCLQDIFFGPPYASSISFSSFSLHYKESILCGSRSATPATLSCPKIYTISALVPKSTLVTYLK